MGTMDLKNTYKKGRILKTVLAQTDVWTETKTNYWTNEQIGNDIHSVELDAKVFF